MTGRLRSWMVALLLLGAMAYALAEEITLTTYYPSPRGVYNELRTAGNVQIGLLDAPAIADPVPRLHLVQGEAAPALRIDDEAPVGSLLDATPFLIDASGNVGLGTASPQKKLDVAGDASVSGNLTVSGQNVCRQDGTNCPPSGTGLNKKYESCTINTTGQSCTATATCDPGTVIAHAVSQSFEWPGGDCTMSVSSGSTQVPLVYRPDCIGSTSCSKSATDVFDVPWAAWACVRTVCINP